FGIHSSMKKEDGFIRLSASDLSSHLDCTHTTVLDYALATGSIGKPDWTNPDTAVLEELGFRHEQRYLQHLSRQGLQIESSNKSAEQTIAAMKKRVDVITQAVLAKGRWFGRADVLRRVDAPSDLGAWSYEVYDCKLARETKAATIL